MQAFRKIALSLPAAALLVAACTDGDTPQRVVGQLESERIELTAEVAEPIESIPVREGQTVTKGELVLAQARDRIDISLQAAAAALAQRQARLDELLRGPRRELIEAARASLEGARREVDFRTLEYQRSRQVVERKLAAPDSADQAKAALDAATASRKVQEAQLQELLQGTTVEELRQAEAAAREAAAILDALRIDAERHHVIAPVDGIVDSLPFEAGERPAPGQAVAILLAGSQPYARVFIPEAIRTQVTPGTPARVFVDGLKAPLQGQVRWVSSEAAFTPYFALTERDRGRLSFSARIDLPDTARRLPDGMPVEVEFPAQDPSG